MIIMRMATGVVILLNPFVASAKMAMMGKVAGRLLMGMAVKV
jgi:hypothetical protein